MFQIHTQSIFLKIKLNALSGKILQSSTISTIHSQPFCLISVASIKENSSRGFCEGEIRLFSVLVDLQTPEEVKSVWCCDRYAGVCLGGS